MAHAMDYSTRLRPPWPQTLKGQQKPVCIELCVSSSFTRMLLQVFPNTIASMLFLYATKVNMSLRKSLQQTDKRTGFARSHAFYCLLFLGLVAWVLLLDDLWYPIGRLFSKLSIRLPTKRPLHDIEKGQRI